MQFFKKLFRFCKKQILSGNTKVPEFYKSRNTRLQRDIVDNGLAISKDYNYVYCRIRKSANSTVISTLYNIETKIKINGLDEIQKIKDNYFTKPSNLSRKEIKLLDEFYKFTIVRNPYNRLWSAYLDKISPKDSVQRKMVLANLKKSINEDITIDEFLTFLENGGLRKNSHWAPQTDFLVFPIYEYDYIGKIENFKEDLEKIIFDIFNIQNVEIISIREHKTSSKNRVISMNEDQKSRIYKLYKEDFIQFNYEKII